MDLGDTSPALIGEMAHVIARKTGGPRGSESMDPAERESYENLILLCPNHHRMIDKAPGQYTVGQILQWKKQHETRMRGLSEGQRFLSKSELFTEVLKLLNENDTIHKAFGPGSEIAGRNPLSQIAELWTFRKLAKIIPNNNRIIALIESNRNLLNPDEISCFSLFREHAVAFEQNAYERLDREGVPMFPLAFQTMVEKGGRHA